MPRPEQILYWREKNKTPERRAKQKTWEKHTREKRKQLWYNGCYLPWYKRKEEIKESERYIAEDILPRLGYVEIIRVAPIFHHFPFDILAKKDGAIYGFNVTTSPHKRLDGASQFIASYFNVRPFVVFLKPDKSRCIFAKVSNRNLVKVPIRLLTCTEDKQFNGWECVVKDDKSM
jgi:hypothetical protein